MSEFDISNLSYYLNQFDDLDPFEFEEMAAQMLRCKGWKDVALTSRTADMGRDIIGVDKKGRKVYVEVKKHKAKVGRPVIQKLHSIMVSENVEKGMVITSSDFSPDAIEYARTTNVKLMNGKRFIEICEYLIRETPRSDSLCTAINIDSMVTKAYKLLDENIFSYPNPVSEYIEKLKFLPFIYIPYLLVNSTVDQDFQNKSGSFYYHMYIPRTLFIFSEDGEFLNKKFKDVNFDNVVDLNIIENKARKKDINIEKRVIPSINRDKLRKYIQRFCTVRRKYRGQNNQVYTRTCRPSLANIDIHGIYKYWQLHTAIDLKVDKYTKFRVLFKDDKITGIVGMNYPTKKESPKEVRMCQKCHALLFKGALKNKYYICQGCGKVLCIDCISEENWCINCAKKFELSDETPVKNKEALKLLKAQYKNWKKRKKQIKLQFAEVKK